MIQNIPFYKRFSNRLAFWILGLLFVAQGLSLFLVNRTSQQSAEENIQRSIIVAQNLFRQAYENDTKSMQNHIEVLSNDYGLRDAFASEDTPHYRVSRQQSQGATRWCRLGHARLTG